MDHKLAEQIVALVDAHIDQLISSLEPLEAHLTPEEFAAYKRGVARVISAYELEIVDRITREHPDLKPPEDDPEGPQGESTPPRHSRN